MGFLNQAKAQVNYQNIFRNYGAESDEAKVALNELEVAIGKEAAKKYAKKGTSWFSYKIYSDSLCSIYPGCSIYASKNITKNDFVMPTWTTPALRWGVL